MRSTKRAKKAPSAGRELGEVAAAQIAALPRGAQAAVTPVCVAPLANELANLPPFSALAPAQLHALVLAARGVALPAGELLFRQGDASQGLFVVVDGAVVPIAEGEARRKLAVLERGDLVGEIGLVTRQPRNASVSALVDSKLVAIDRGALFSVMRSDPELARAILQPVRRRMLDRQLRTNRFFAAFLASERAAIARQFRLMDVEKGTRIVRRGAPPEGLYIVLAGALAEHAGVASRRSRRLSIGDVFGGAALLAGRPAEVDVVAESKAWLMMLGENRLRRLVAAHPRLVRVLERISDPPNAQTSATAASPDRPSRPSAASSSSSRVGAAGRARESRS